MGGGFDDREKSIEAKWAHDEDLRFRATARRNRLLARWAAEAIGLSGTAAETYVAAFLELEVRGARDKDLVRKIHYDFTARSVAYSEHFIERKMEDLAAEATRQVMNENEA